MNYTGRKLLGSTLRILLCVAFGFPLLLYFYQDHLIFQPKPLAEESRDFIARNVSEARELQVVTTDELTLHGWLRQPTATSESPLAIYFGGNAEEISWMVDMTGQFSPWSIALFNYRGYGLSEGKPSEVKLFEDALTLYDNMVAREDIDASRIVAFGRSLGSGVAVHLAANRPVRAVVLVSPYDSLTSVAQNIYPWVPVRWLIRHPFDSLSLAPTIKAPLLTLVASEDVTIPPDHSRRLYDAWAGPKQWVLIEGENHDTIAAAYEYWKSIGDYLRSLD